MTKVPGGFHTERHKPSTDQIFPKEVIARLQEDYIRDIVDVLVRIEKRIKDKENKGEAISSEEREYMRTVSYVDAEGTTLFTSGIADMLDSVFEQYIQKAIQLPSTGQENKENYTKELIAFVNDRLSKELDKLPEGAKPIGLKWEVKPKDAERLVNDVAKTISRYNDAKQAGYIR